MRRLILLSAATLSLISCATRSDADPYFVLQQSAKANQNLPSATFSLESTFNIYSAFLGGQSEGELRANGLVQNGGKQMQFTAMAEGTTGTEQSPWEVTADVTVAAENETYVRVQKATADAMHNPAIAALQEIQGLWLLLPSSASGTGVPGITPDPSILRMQTEVMNVLQDKGIVTIGGRKTHHYKINVDMEKLISFFKNMSASRGETFDEAGLRESMKDLTIQGEMWIDASSYVLRRLQWNIDSSDTVKPLGIRIHVDITNAPNQPAIKPPTDAGRMPAPDILPSI